MAFINAIDKIVATLPGNHTECGQSIISYGPMIKKFMNQTFIGSLFMW